MAPRITPDSIAGPALNPENPGAYPVDPYVRPYGNSSVERLASALGDLAPSLQRLTGDFVAQESEKGQRSADAAFLDMKDKHQQIKDGRLDPAGSPWFRRAYHERIGSLAAASYRDALDEQMRDPNSPLSQSTDPADFDKFESGFRQQWIDANVGKGNNDFSAGFNASTIGNIENARAHFVAQAGERLQANAIDALYAGHQVIISDVLKDSSLSPEAQLNAIADGIKIDNQRQYFLNPKSGTQITNATVQAVFDAARTFHNPELLKVLDRIDSAIPGATLAQTQAASSKIAEVRNAIFSDIKKDDAAAAYEQKKQKQAAIDNAIDGVWSALDAADDPSKVDIKPFADALTGLAPEQKARLYSIKDSYVKRDERETAAQAGPLFERAFRGTLTFEDVADAFGAGQISKDTAKELRSQIRLNKAGKGAQSLVQDPRYRQVTSDLEGLFKNQMGQFFSPVTAAQATVAKWQLERDWVRWRMGPGRDSGDEEAAIWLQQRSAELFSQSAGVPITANPQKQAAEILTNFAQQRSAAQLTDWTKTRVVSPNFLTRIETEATASKSGKNFQFSAPVASFLRGYRLNSLKDIDAFIAAQKKLPEQP